jgi:hypothetical protein
VRTISWRQQDLVTRAAHRGLKTNGVAVKKDGALTSTTTGNKKAQPTKKRNEPSMERHGYQPGTYWKGLEPAKEPVEEPDNPTHFHAPTIPADEADVVPVKFNFNATFAQKT